MGKALIIKGADFSKNALEKKVVIVDLTDKSVNGFFSLQENGDFGKTYEHNGDALCLNFVATTSDGVGLALSFADNIIITIPQGYDYKIALLSQPNIFAGTGTIKRMDFGVVSYKTILDVPTIVRLTSNDTSVYPYFGIHISKRSAVLPVEQAIADGFKVEKVYV